MMQSATLRERMTDLCRRERLPPAILLAGEDPEALQSESTQLVSALLCAAPADSRPCGACRSCHKIMAGTHPDFRAIRPEGKELKIGDVRELLRWLQIAPFESPLKAAVLEQAETLNVAAANSLLKTLEEPPPHARLILLARTPETLLPTIRSRLALFRFPATAESAAEEPPSWMPALEKLLAGGTPPPEALFDLTEEVGRDAGELKNFFGTLEREERNLLAKLLASNPADPRARRLERLFEITLAMERETLQRYGNTSLCLDGLWIEIQNALRNTPPTAP